MDNFCCAINKLSTNWGEMRILIRNKKLISQQMYILNQTKWKRSFVYPKLMIKIWLLEWNQFVRLFQVLLSLFELQPCTWWNKMENLMVERLSLIPSLIKITIGCEDFSSTKTINQVWFIHLDTHKYS